MVRISKARREKLRDALFTMVAEMAPEVVEELRQELDADPYQLLADEARAFNLLVREAYKICLDVGLRQDGNRDKLKRDAIGTSCGFCGEAMAGKAEMELDHTVYDGRPPRAVHKSCHKKHQPH